MPKSLATWINHLVISCVHSNSLLFFSLSIGTGFMVSKHYCQVFIAMALRVQANLVQVKPNQTATLFILKTYLLCSWIHHWIGRTIMFRWNWWSVALISKNMWKCIDGSIPKPDRFDPSYDAWERCNNLVHSWIFNSVSSSITQSIVHTKLAIIVWKNLK